MRMRISGILPGVMEDEFKAYYGAGPRPAHSTGPDYTLIEVETARDEAFVEALSTEGWPVTEAPDDGT